MAQKSSELEQYLQRVRELEGMYHRLEEALEDERQAKQDEEAMRKLQARSRKHAHTHTCYMACGYIQEVNLVMSAPCLRQCEPD